MLGAGYRLGGHCGSSDGDNLGLNQGCCTGSGKRMRDTEHRLHVCSTPTSPTSPSLSPPLLFIVADALPSLLIEK